MTVDGWTEVANAAVLTGSTQYRVFFRKLDGTEGATTTFTSSVTGSSSTFHHVFYFENADLNAAAPIIAEATETTATSTAPNSPNFAPGLGSLDILWGSFAVADGNFTLSAYPTNYSLHQRNTLRTISAFRALTAASEDPGAFTITSRLWKAKTIGILGRPLAADSVTVTKQSAEALITDGAQAVRVTKQSAEALITDGDQKVRVTKQSIDIMLAMNYSARRSRNRAASF